MLTSSRWSENWRAVAPSDAVPVDLPRSKRAWANVQERVRTLPVGTTVVLRDGALGSRWRCRRFAERAGVRLDRTYLAMPTVSAPAYLVQDSSASVAYFCRAILTVPPGLAVLAGPVEALLRSIRLLAPWRAVATLVPGRVVVGHRA